MAGALADARPGLRRRRSRDRWRRARRPLIALVALLLVIGVVVVLWATPVFSVRRVTVDGTSLLTADEVRARAAIPQGLPLVRVDAQQASERVATLPEVASVTVKQSWPSSVAITVRERTAVVQRKQGDSYQWIDASGVIFHTDAKPRPQVVTVTTASSDRRLLGDLATVASSLTPALRKAVVTMKADSPDTITVVLTDNRTIVWGSAEQSQTKAQVATALLQVKATVYDVSSPANPTSR